MKNSSEQIRLTTEHEIILEQLKAATDRYLSSADLHGLTNIEPIKISAIIADLLAHGILHHTNSESGDWVYILTDYGRNFVRKTQKP